MDQTWILDRLSGSKIDRIPIKWIGMDQTWILTRLSGFKLDSNQSFLIANLILPHPSIKFFQPLHFTTFYPYSSQPPTPTVPHDKPHSCATQTP